MFKNYTPHTINIVGHFSIDPELQPARCHVESHFAGTHQGVPLVKSTFGRVSGLPDPEPGVLLIVSMVVRSACPDRIDLVSPGDLERDEEGRVIGCKNLVKQ